MTPRERLLTAVALGLMILTALSVKAWSSLQRLGQPGVKVVQEPFPGIDPRASGTNRTFVAGPQQVFLNPDIPGYRSEVLPVDRIVHEWLPSDTTYGQRVYTTPDGLQIQNLVVLMGTDRTSIHQPQYCLYGAGWTIGAQQKTTVRIPAPFPYDLPVTRLTTSRKFKDPQGKVREVSGVFVYWFVTDDHLSNDHKERMWLMARDLILRRTLQRWAYIICFAPCVPGSEDQTFKRIQDFMAASVPQYQLVPAAPASSDARAEALTSGDHRQ